MSFILVDAAAQIAGLQEMLQREASIALDCEAAGFHRYSDRLCLVQLSTPERTYLFDVLSFDPSDVLRPVLEDPRVQVVMHGSGYDLRLLDHDLDIRATNLMDTQIAAALLGEPALGLAALLERILGVEVSKKHQRADWAKRPLPADMLEYAATDSRHLLDMGEHLRSRLEKEGRWEWAREEFRLLEGTRWDPDPEEDTVVRVRGARDLTRRELARLREALAWRDGIARESDRALFRVVGDGPLLEVARLGALNLGELRAVGGLSPRLVSGEGKDLISRLEMVESLPETQLPPLPRPSRNGPGRPPPEVDVIARRLKVVRNRRASELGMDRGTLLPNAVLMEIARKGPGTQAELEAVHGVRRWQTEELGPRLLEVLAG